jgi:hypothetical protein
MFCGLGANMPGGNISGRNTRIGEMVELAGGINPSRSLKASALSPKKA